MGRVLVRGNVTEFKNAIGLPFGLMELVKELESEGIHVPLVTVDEDTATIVLPNKALMYLVLFDFPALTYIKHFEASTPTSFKLQHPIATEVENYQPPIAAILRKLQELEEEGLIEWREDAARKLESGEMLPGMKQAVEVAGLYAPITTTELAERDIFELPEAIGEMYAATHFGTLNDVLLIPEWEKYGTVFRYVTPIGELARYVPGCYAFNDVAILERRFPDVRYISHIKRRYLEPAFLVEHAVPTGSPILLNKLLGEVVREYVPVTPSRFLKELGIEDILFPAEHHSPPLAMIRSILRQVSEKVPLRYLAQLAKQTGKYTLRFDIKVKSSREEGEEDDEARWNEVLSLALPGNIIIGEPRESDEVEKLVRCYRLYNNLLKTLKDVVKNRLVLLELTGRELIHTKGKTTYVPIIYFRSGDLWYYIIFPTSMLPISHGTYITRRVPAIVYASNRNIIDKVIDLVPYMLANWFFPLQGLSLVLLTRRGIKS